MTSSWVEPLSDAALADTWTAAWQLLGKLAPFQTRLDLEAAWTESHRHYHDGRHLRQCLALWSITAEHCSRPGEVAIALWFHDAVYNPTAKDNELQSASWASRVLAQASVDSAVSQRVYDLVMATCHHGVADSDDARLLVDIDLALLGSPPERFATYDRDIRREYAEVPDGKYRDGRRQVLERFLARPVIYQTAVLRDRLEVQARVNLAQALDWLGQ